MNADEKGRPAHCSMPILAACGPPDARCRGGRRARPPGPPHGCRRALQRRPLQLHPALHRRPLPLRTRIVGEPLRHLRARVRLQALVSEYGWALWGAIQAAASSIDFDFFSWGQERFDKAASTFTSPRFERLLEEVVRDD